MSDPAPLSKTAKYKKITKPLLERKRRARINRCLDELKDLMVGALEIDDDNLSKLEKADILELTVNHLTKLHKPKDPVLEAKKFEAGFGQCAAEACRFIMSVPDLDNKVSQNLVSHLSRMITEQPLSIHVPERQFSPPVSPSSVASDRQHYYSDHDRSSSDAEDSVYSSEIATKQWAYSRPYPAQIKPTPPLSGLLTTVDKLPAPIRHEDVHSNGLRHGNMSQYFNRVPAEAKDVVLQKIRQHIMDKRGNETSNGDGNIHTEHNEQKYLHRDDAYRTDNISPAQFLPSNINNNNYTLDLRKVRSPLKSTPQISPKKIKLENQEVQRTGHPEVTSKIKSETRDEVAPSLPEQCQLPMDYNNLPPKKKRKLIEYQEYKKQEEAKRRQDAFYAAKKDCFDRPEDGDEANKWRPW